MEMKDLNSIEELCELNYDERWNLLNSTNNMELIKKSILHLQHPLIHGALENPYLDIKTVEWIFLYLMKEADYSGLLSLAEKHFDKISANLIDLFLDDVERQLKEQEVINLLLISYWPQKVTNWLLSYIEFQLEEEARAILREKEKDIDNVSLELLKEKLATSSHISEKSIIKLSNDPAIDVRANAAANPILPDSEFERLFEDKLKVKYGLASNSRLSDNYMEKLSYENDPNIQTQLLRNSNVTKKVVFQILKITTDKDVILVAASTKFAPNQLLSDFSCSDNARQRLTAARNPKTPLIFLKCLCHDEDICVKHAALKTIEKK